MAGVKAELEIWRSYLESDEYKALARQVKARKVERDRTIERMRALLSDGCAAPIGLGYRGRPKNLWSIFKR
jgi:(p)ppGpp synthase/HD superfamily hydrolase